MNQMAPVRKTGDRKRRNFWLKQLHTWHWISSAIALIGLLLFAFTGITLNHAADIEGAPVTQEKTATLPPPLLKALEAGPAEKGPLPAPVAEWVSGEFGVVAGGRSADWSEDEVYLALPRPGGDGWVSIDRLTGEAINENTSRGWISYLNDLHKGRNAGTAWAWFIDVFSVACFIFALTGLVLLQMHSAKRPSTWPLVAAGLILPAILAIFFIH